jgi:hypothetical protein
MTAAEQIKFISEEMGDEIGGGRDSMEAIAQALKLTGTTGAMPKAADAAEYGKRRIMSLQEKLSGVLGAVGDKTYQLGESGKAIQGIMQSVGTESPAKQASLATHMLALLSDKGDKSKVLSAIQDIVGPEKAKQVTKQIREVMASDDETKKRIITTLEPINATSNEIKGIIRATNFSTLADKNADGSVDKFFDVLRAFSGRTSTVGGEDQAPEGGTPEEDRLLKTLDTIEARAEATLAGMKMLADRLGY